MKCWHSELDTHTQCTHTVWGELTSTVAVVNAQRRVWLCDLRVWTPRWMLPMVTRHCYLIGPKQTNADKPFSKPSPISKFALRKNRCTNCSVGVFWNVSSVLVTSSAQFFNIDLAFLKKGGLLSRSGFRVLQCLHRRQSTQ